MAEKNFIEIEDAFNSFQKMFEKIGEVAKQKGTRLVTIMAGISMLIFVFIKHFIFVKQFADPKATQFPIDYIDLTLIICAVVIISLGLIVSSLEYKTYVNSRKQDKKLLFNKYKMELEYNIRRLELTDLDISHLRNNLNEENDNSKADNETPPR